MNQTSERFAVLLHSGDYDRLHNGLSAAAAATAAGRRVDVIFFWWALERLLTDELDEPDFGPGKEAVEARFEARGMPTLRMLLQHLKESGRCTLYACSGSLAAVASTPGETNRHVDRCIGWNGILALTAGVDRLCL